VAIGPGATGIDGEFRQLLADMEEAEGLFHNAAPKGNLRVNLRGTLARHFCCASFACILATLSKYRTPHRRR
jgi:hypothetical protein